MRAVVPALIAVVAVLALGAQGSWAQPIGYEGILEQDGALADGAFDIHAFLYADDARAVLLFDEALEDVAVVDGRFAVALGAAGLPVEVALAPELFIALDVDGVPLEGTQRILAVPRSLAAASASTFEVVGTAGTAKVSVVEESPTAQLRTLLRLRNNGGIQALFERTDGADWQVSNFDATLEISVPSSVPPQMVINQNGNMTIGGTSYLTGSDVRNKRALRPVSDVLAKLERIHAVTFERAGRPGERSIGVLAQDVERSFPEAVATDERGFKSVAYGNLVAPLIDAVKLLEAERRTHREQIAGLEARLAKLEARAP